MAGDPVRLRAVRSALDLYAARQATFDRLATLAARALRAPVAQVNLLTDERQVSISSIGPAPWAGGRSVSLEASICSNVIRTGEPLLIDDARLHPASRDNRATTESGVVAYAAAPLKIGDDLVLGTLCVVDFEPRGWTAEEEQLLVELAGFVVSEMEWRGHRESDIRHLLAVLDSSDDAIVGVDRDAVIQSWNPGAERLLGYRSSEIVGKPSESIMPPREREHFLNEIKPRLWRGEPLPRFETVRTHRNGHAVPVSIVATPVCDLAGRVTGATGVIRDLSARVAAEQALRRSEERWRALVENAADFIWLLDEHGRFTEVLGSTERELGYAPGALIGRALTDLLHPGEAAAITPRVESLLRSEDAALQLEARIRCGDGSWRTLLLYVRNLLHNPAVRGVVVNSRDVTEQRRTEEMLRHAQKMDAVGRLAGGVAHDFNNVLTAIKGYCQFVLDRVSEQHELREDVEQIDRAVDRATGIVRQLLTFSRRQIAQSEVVDVNDVVRDMERMLRHSLSADVQLVPLLDPQPAHVLADRGQLEQVLVNLVVNARDAMPQGGRLVIRVERKELNEESARMPQVVPPGRYVALSVTDTGVGIPPDVQEHIFEPFFTTKERGAGTGLGLATVYGIVTQAKGFVWLYSEVEHGTTFQIHLPEVASAEAHRPVASAPAQPAQSASAAVVLLVEDDAAVRAMATRVLERQGITVIATPSAEEALTIASNRDFDLLLTDVVLPGMSGSELATRLLESRPELRVVFASGYAEDEMAHRGLLRPDVRFLEKPYSPADLLAKVRDAIGAAA